MVPRRTFANVSHGDIDYLHSTTVHHLLLYGVRREILQFNKENVKRKIHVVLFHREYAVLLYDAMERNSGTPFGRFESLYLDGVHWQRICYPPFM